MKKQLLLAAFIVFTTTCFAQLKPSFGIRGGVSSAGMRGDAVNNFNDMLDFANGMITTGDRTSFFAGANLTIPITDLISVEPGMYYTQKGYEMRGSYSVKNAGFLSANAKAKINLDYVELPVLLKATMNGFQVFAGPQLSYLAQADFRTTAGVLGINLLNKTMDATDKFNRWDAGVTGGIGYKLANGVNIQASYDHGFSKVDANQNFNSYNRSFKVGAGISF